MKTLFALAILVSISFANWTETGADPSLPSEVYFVGLGISEKSLELAKRQAQNDIQKQIRVSLNSRFYDELESKKIRGKEHQFENQKMKMFAVGFGELEGVQISKTSEINGVYYALASLDKSLFAENLIQKIKRLNLAIDDEVNQSDQYLVNQKVDAALQHLFKARLKLLESEDLLKSLRAVQAPSKDLFSVYTEEKLMIKIEDGLNTLKSEQISGFDQAIDLGELPTEPFVIKVTSDNQPISSFEYLVLQDGNEIGTVLSDENGEVVYYASDKIITRPGLNTLSFEPSLKVSSKFKRKLRRLTSNFSFQVKGKSQSFFISFDGIESEKSEQSLVKKLERAGFLNDSKSENVLEVDVKASVLKKVQGISESSSFQKINLELNFTHGDSSIIIESSGMGRSIEKAKANAIEKLNFNSLTFALNADEKITQYHSKKSVAVLPFKTSSNRNVKNLSDRLRNQILVSLSTSKKIELVEREHLDKVLGEQSLVLSGLVENDEFDVSEVTGADYLIVGELIKRGAVYDFFLRIVDVSAGKVVGSMAYEKVKSDKLKLVAKKAKKEIKSKLLQ